VTFKKGQSGNPKGKGAPWNIIERAREIGPKAIDMIVTIMDDVTAEPRVRLDAAKYIVDRGYGKPYQAIELTGTDKGPLRVVSGAPLTEEQWEKTYAALDSLGTAAGTTESTD